MSTQQNNPENKKAQFGFREVAWQDKAPMVRGVFNNVASSYDLMNDLMSFGLHRYWKHTLINMLAPRPGKRLLDVAGGTGDIAERFMQAAGSESGCSVTICDINENMLLRGRDRLLDKNRYHAMEWVCGNAECLPVEDRSFDYYTIAFGIRNVTDIPAALREAYRVLRPGGRFLCLEFSHISQPFLAKLYDSYSFNVIPKLGEWVAKDAASYQYLVESIRTFPTQGDFANMIREAGFSGVKWTDLNHGITAIHSGWRT